MGKYGLLILHPKLANNQVNKNQQNELKQSKTAPAIPLGRPQ